MSRGGYGSQCCLPNMSAVSQTHCRILLPVLCVWLGHVSSSDEGLDLEENTYLQEEDLLAFSSPLSLWLAVFERGSI